MKSFVNLVELHRELDELFQEYQRALLRLELDRASEVLAQYENELLAHIRDEEELMLPLYRERTAAPVGGAVKIFLSEHGKLRQFVRSFIERTRNLQQMDDVEAGVLDLIDSQHLFKQLLEHHDEREMKTLYPLLDRVTTKAERQDLFAKLQLAQVNRMADVA